MMTKRPGIKIAKAAGFMILLISLIFPSFPVRAEGGSENNGSVKEGYILSSGGKIVESANEEEIVDIGNGATIFLWLSLMQLKEEGKVDFKADATKYLPEDFVKNAKFKYPFTIEDLMNQTAGFQQVYLGRNRLFEDPATPLADSLLASKPAQIYSPGAFVAWSDWGCALAALIVETQSGTSYPEYVHAHILDPLQMQSTAVSQDYSDCPAVQAKMNLSGQIISVFYPANSALSTPGDLSILLSDLTADHSKILSDQAKEEFFTPTLMYRNGLYARISNGLFVYHEYDKPVYGFRSYKNPDCVELYISEDLETFLIYASEDAKIPERFHEYPKEVFGNARIGVGPFKVPLENLAGQYVKADTVVRGSGRFTSIFDTVSLTKLSRNELSVSSKKGEPYLTQICDDGFISVNGDVGYFYYSPSGEKIIEYPERDLIPTNPFMVIFKIALLIALYVGFLFSILLLVIAFLRFLIRKAKGAEKEKRTFRKYMYIQSGVFILFTIIFSYMVMGYLMGSSATIGKTAMFMYYIGSLLSFVYIIFFGRTGIKEDCSDKEKVLYYVTAVFAAVLILFSPVFGLIIFT